MWSIESTISLLRNLSTTSEPSELLRLILDAARLTTGVDRAIVLSRAGLEYPLYRVALTVDHGVVVAPEKDNDSARSGGVLADLLYAGEFRTISMLSVDRSDPASDVLGAHRTLYAFPLFEQGKCEGLVALLAPLGNICEVSELCMLAIMGALLRQADQARTLTGQLAKACHSLEAELAAAASVQRWLLPLPAPPATGVRAASFYRTAHHAGGDYYDAGPLRDGGFGVLIADVSGHGAAAAVLMAILRTIVHDEVDRFRSASAAALLDYADKHFCAIGLPSRGAFITAFSGTLDTGSGLFTYCSAGHPHPRLLRASGGPVTPLTGATSLPMGILDTHPARSEEAIQLQPGDLLVFYSDGINESRSPRGEFFGVERIDRILSELRRPVSPEAAVQAIQDAVETFSGPSPPIDDQTLLAVCWQPVQAE